MTCNVEKTSSNSALKFPMLSQTGLQETLSLTQSGRSSAAEPSRCWGGGEGRWADGWEGRGGCVVSLRSGRGLYLSTLTLAVSLLRGTTAIIAAANQPIRARLCECASQKSHVSGREWLTMLPHENRRCFFANRQWKLPQRDPHPSKDPIRRHVTFLVLKISTVVRSIRHYPISSSQRSRQISPSP